MDAITILRHYWAGWKKYFSGHVRKLRFLLFAKINVKGKIVICLNAFQGLKGDPGHIGLPGGMGTNAMCNCSTIGKYIY